MSYKQRGELLVFVGDQIVDSREAECGTDATSDFKSDLYREMYEQGFTEEEVNIIWVPLPICPLASSSCPNDHDGMTDVMKFKCELYSEMYKQGFTKEEINSIWVPLEKVVNGYI
jgi:hypothetical protein